MTDSVSIKRCASKHAGSWQFLFDFIVISSLPQNLPSILILHVHAPSTPIHKAKTTRAWLSTLARKRTSSSAAPVYQCGYLLRNQNSPCCVCWPTPRSKYVWGGRNFPVVYSYSPSELTGYYDLRGFCHTRTPFFLFLAAPEKFRWCVGTVALVLPLLFRETALALGVVMCATFLTSVIGIVSSWRCNNVHPPRLPRFEIACIHAPWSEAAWSHWLPIFRQDLLCHPFRCLTGCLMPPRLMTHLYPINSYA